MSHPLIRIVPASEDDADLWRLTRQVTQILKGLPWVLIGGQMVAALEAEHGRAQGRATVDVDTLVDVRARSTATLEAARRLVTAGFVPQLDEDGLSYRFSRDVAVVDVLAPDNLGERANLTTVPPGSTLQTIGGTQAIRRSRTVVVDAGDGQFELSLPSLTGAIVIKSLVVSATASTSRPKHLRDLARLLGLVSDPRSTRQELTTKERIQLRSTLALLTWDHPAWQGINAAQDAAMAIDIITSATTQEA